VSSPSIFILPHFSKDLVGCPYNMVLSRALMTKYDHILCYLCIYFCSNILTSL